MQKNKATKYIAFVLCLLMTFNSFADLKIDEYFLGLEPQKQIYKLYDNSRKEELKKNVIAYDDIEDMIHLYNPEILTTWNDWESNKSSQDIYNDYMDAADKLSGGGGDSDVADAMLKAQADAMRIQADKSADDSYTNFLSNYLAEKQLVLSTKILDLEYHKSAYTLDNAREAIYEILRKEETAKNALSVGEGTNVDYLTAKKAVADAKSALVVAESNQNSSKRNLIINCGKSMNDNVSISDIPLTMDLLITSVNLNDDYDYALKHNIQYEIYRRKKENAITDEVKKEYQIKLDAAPQKIYNDLENKYSTILDCIDTYNNKETAYKLALDTLKKAENEYATGKISLKEYKTAEYNANVARNDVPIAQYDLKIAVENYKASKEGYYSC